MTATAGGVSADVHAVLPTSLGELTVVREGDSLTGLYFARHWPPPERAEFGVRSDEGFDEVASQLGEYLDGCRFEFELRLKIRGTEFDRRVWELVTGVGYGETTTYGGLARRLGSGTDPRDVGAAVGRNPLCIIIPCHRVVGATGKLTGYAGGLSRKRSLLEIEQAAAVKAGWARGAAVVGAAARLVPGTTTTRSRPVR